MNDSLRLGKRAFAVAVAAATILWSVGISAFVAPLTAEAATPGTLVKGTTLSTVYYYASNGSRYAFPNEKTYFTWYSDFAGVQTISDSELAAIPLAGNIVYRPGSRWIKIQSDPKTYVVTPQGQIRWVESEEVAKGLAGDDWNMMIDDVPDVFFVDYTVGASLTSATNAHNGALVAMDGNTYLVWDGMKRMVTSAGFTANRFQTRSILDGSGMTLAGLTAGSNVTAMEGALTDPAQMGGAVVGSGLTATLASDTPATATLPSGATGVDMLHVNLMASEATTVNTLALTLTGVNATSDIASSGVYLYNGNDRITEGKSVVSSTRMVTFSALNLNIGAGDTANLRVVADVASAASAGNTVGFSLASASDITATSSVNGSFPLSGNIFTIGSQGAGTVTITKNGTIVQPTLGTQDHVIGQFKLSPSSEDGMLEQVTLKIDNAADHGDFKLWQDDTLVATGVSIGSDLVRFTLASPFTVQEGNSRIFKVTADIGGENGDDIKVYLDKSADLIVKGSDFGYNLTVTRTGYDGDSCTTAGGDCSWSEVQGGELTFAFNGPAVYDINLGATDVSLFDFTVTASQAVTIDSIPFTIDGTGLVDASEDIANFEDVKLVNKETGVVVAGPEEFDATAAEAAQQTITFTDDIYLAAGESMELMLSVDTSESGDLTSGDTVYASLTTGSVAADDANGDSLASGDIVPSSTLTGNTHNILSAAMVVSIAQPPSSSTYVKGTSNAEVVAFSFDVNEASDLTVTDFTLNAIADGTSNDTVTNSLTIANFVNSCSLYDGLTGTLLDGPQSFSSGEAVYSGMNWVIPAGDTAKMLVKCNFANVAVDGGNADEYLFFIDEDQIGSDVAVLDEDGDDIDPTVGAADTNEGTQTTIIDIVGEGSLSVAAAAGMPDSTLILGASNNVTVAKYRFSATSEDFVVKKFELYNCVTSAVDEDIDCTGDGDETAGSDDVASTVMVTYTNSAGASETKTGLLSGNRVTFSGLDFLVPADDTADVTVSVNTNSVGTSLATSGSQIQLNFNGEDDGEAGGVTQADFEAIGAGSGSTLDETDITDYVLANDMVLTKTKPTISLASGSPSGASVPGLGEVLRFTIAADSKGYVAWSEILFKMTSTDNSGTPTEWNECVASGTGIDDSELSLYEINDLGNEIEGADTDWTFFDSSDGTVCDPTNEVIDYIQLDLGNDEEEIEAGSSKTYVLYMDTTGASAANDDSLRIDIIDQPTVNTLSAGAWDGNALDDEEAFEWDDANTSGTDRDGLYVKNLPVIGGTIIY